MFEGRLNPPVEDLHVLNDAMKASDWAARFGAIIDLPRIQTISNGKEVSMTGKDLMLRYMLRHKAFAQGFVSPSITYDEALSSARFGPQAMLDELITSACNECRPSIWFMSDSSGEADYQALRTRKFIPFARKNFTPVMTSAAPGKSQGCDQLAALPQDPEAAAAGVADERLNAAAVIYACELAIKQDAAQPRLRFQLARGYLAAGRLEDAAEQLIASAGEGHGASLAYLADLYLDGMPGIEADPELAYSLYEKAVEAGFKPAKAMLAEFKDASKELEAAEAEEEKLTAELKKTNPELFVLPVEAHKPVDPDKIDFEKFFMPSIAASTYNGNLAQKYEEFKAARRASYYDLRDELVKYFTSASNFLRREEFDTACRTVVDTEFVNALRTIEALMDDQYESRSAHPVLDSSDPVGGLVTLFSSKDARDKEHYDGLRQAIEAGKIDMGILVYDYGGCSDVPVKRFYANAKAFLLKVVEEYKDTPIIPR
jgi:TPR repeat protein